MDETNELHKTMKGIETSWRSDSDHWDQNKAPSRRFQCSIDQFHRMLLTTSEEDAGLFGY